MGELGGMGELGVMGILVGAGSARQSSQSSQLSHPSQFSHPSHYSSKKHRTMTTTEEFIRLNADADVRRLALSNAGRKDIDLTYALEQIAGRQKAKAKLPRWAAADGIIYPPALAMEQCSSEPTARYKAGVAGRLLADAAQARRPHWANMPDNPAEPCATPDVLVDLTGGFGVDFSYMAPLFGRAVYIERQGRLCDAVRHNMPLLGIAHAEVVCGDCTQIIKVISRAALVYADPARRSASGGRTYAVADCTPDMLAMKEMLLEKADFIMIKLSPMLDWRKAAADFGGCAGEVHIVSAGNECKELLLVLSGKYDGLERIYCVNDGQELSFAPSELTRPSHDSQSSHFSYLYEPNPSVMKAGCFGLLEERYGVRQIGRNSHLFVSQEVAADFPGRRFAVETVTTMNKRELKAALAGTAQANISVRNFPLTADALRKKLKLKDGGGTYIFGTTDSGGRHVLIICRKE